MSKLIDENKALFFFVLVYLFVTIVSNTYLFLKVVNLPDLNTKVPAQVSLCINHPPKINYSCNTSIYQDQNFFCVLNAIDEDNETTFFWDLFVLSGPSDFNLVGDIIDFTPNASQIGNYSFAITVWDSSNCQNNYDYQIKELNVINVNDPPVLILPIPNQTIMQDSYVSFDLDMYFLDYDNDPLTYTTLPEIFDNFIVIIDSNNVVTIAPVSGWSGQTDIIFIAWDPYYANATSNLVKIEVTPKQIIPEQPITRATGGGGRSLGNIPDCIPKWYCRPFGKCEPDNFRRRDCYDLNNCSTDLGKPNTTEPCIFISTCYDGFKGNEEEGIDCGGPCPPCGNCYDNICNNEEDCTKGLTNVPDCGGPCNPCVYEKKVTCYDLICNNNEDCTKGLTNVPDCGGPCNPCLAIEQPKKSTFNYGLFSLLVIGVLTSYFLLKHSYPIFSGIMKKRKRKYYEERLLLEAKISESIFESILKLEKLLLKEDTEKLIFMFSNIIRRYFKSLFNLNYEFTYEELIKEINSRKISNIFKNVLINFFERSTEIEFSGKSVSKEELGAMFSEFKQILSLTSEVNLVDNNLVHKRSATMKEETKLDQLFYEISEAETLLRQKNINGAYFKYLRIVNEFKVLDYSEKKKIINFIERLYDEIKLAREQL